MALVSNVLRTYVKNYEIDKSVHTEGQLIDLVESHYMNKTISKYEYEKFVKRIEDKVKRLTNHGK